MNTSASVQLRNNVTTLGYGPRTLIFVNGFGCDQTIWRFVAPSLASDHHVVLFDYVGSGRADASAYDPRRYGSLDGYARDLVEIAEALDLRDAVLVGHSVGCTVGIYAALQLPKRFERLVFVCPSPRFLDDPPDYVGGFQRSDIEGLLELMDRNYLGWAESFSGMVLKEPGLARELNDTFCSLDRRAASRFAELTFLSDARAYLPRVRQPCLVLQCARDDIAPTVVGEYVREHLPRSKYVLLDAEGHCPHVSHPREVEARVREYLRTPLEEL
ncbi:MAG TPA: alpha/beta hydrolase [Polyangiaceae bacterium]|nr:alpha/beta hydrolase [Polyangiaceae bacterium]